MNVKIGLPPPEIPPSSPQTRPSDQPAGHSGANLAGHSRLLLWLHRLAVLLLVFFCATVGVLLLLLPWRQEWTDNSLLLRWPALRPVISSGFFRGLCSGLGVLDIWIGFWEAVHYSERKQ
ncbi:MAG TPA: hypothetical protein VLW84_00515 [Terriglobales bacterium]|nr:hypothetical protein [Terriglobales bacterium]